MWLLVPSRLLGAHLLGLAARHGVATNLHALTFTDLAARVLGGGWRSRPVPPVGERLVLRQAIREAVPDDGYFRRVREARRFPAALAQTLTELRTAGVRPEDLERAAVDAGPASTRKLRELASIVARVDAALGAAGLHHPTDALWAAAARAAGPPTLEEPRALLAYGFTDWNAAERTLVAAVATRVPTTGFVPIETDPPVEPAAGLLAWLETQGFRIENEPGPAPSGLRALAARLFRDPVPPGAGTSGLEIVAAPGEEREVREVARGLLRAAADGVPFEAAGILLRHPDAYRSVIRDVLGAARIPYTWGVPSRLGETRAGQSLRLLLGARRENFARATVLEFLAAAELRDGDDVPPAEWDRLSRAARIVEGAADWRRGLGWLGRQAEATAPRDGSPPDDGGASPEGRFPRAAIAALGRVIDTLLRSLARMPEVAPAATLARRLGRAFGRLCRRTPDATQVLAGLARVEALGALRTPVDLDEFADLVETLLDEPVEGEPESLGGRVLVSELRQALGLPFRMVAIPGLVEQGFPAPPRPDPILTDPERRRLHAQVPGGRPGLRLAAGQPAEERSAFCLAAAAADERLLLSYPRVDPHSGRARVPSFFLLRVAEAATGMAHDFTRLEDAFPAHVRVPLIPAPPRAVGQPLDRREWLLAQAVRARPAGAAGETACLALAPYAARGRAALRAREHGDRLGEWDGLLPSALRPVLAARHGRVDAPVAATPLETYATCPFRYYLAHVLRIRPVVEPARQPALSPVDRGRLLHAVLADAYAALRAEGALPLRPERLPLARAILERSLAGVETRLGVSALTPFWNGERARLLTDLHAALAAEARATLTGEPWVPTEFEAAFGTGGAGEGGPPVAHALPDGRVVRFQGRLDRLDLSPDGTRARVIDYKSGVSPGGAGGRLAGGTALQLPIYRLGAEALCRAREPSAEVAEAQYYYLTRRGRRRRLAFTATDWLRRRDDFDRALAAILDGIAAGRFFQNPSAETCRGCDYPVACGTERELIAWAAQKAADPAREAYQRLQDIE